MTGVLPIALGRATKVMPVVVHSVKEYICVMELHKDVSKEQLEEAVKYFTGRLYQRPPVRSSVKRALRIRRIFDIELLEKDGRHVLLRVRCESGTYMRKLCHDIGLYLGIGAHMRELRRIRTGPFTEEKTIKLHDLSEAVYEWRETRNVDRLRNIILPIEIAMCMIPKIIIKDTAVAAIAHGADLGAKGIVAYTEDVTKNRYVALFTQKGELIGLGKALVGSDGIKDKDEGYVVKTKRVIMEPDAYPILWRKKRKAM